MPQVEFLVLMSLLLIACGLLLALLFRRNTLDVSPLLQTLQLLQQSGERAERELRQQVQVSAQATRQELGGNFAQFQQTMAAQMTSVATLQNSQIDAFAQQLAKLTEGNAQQLETMRSALVQQTQATREEQSVTLKRFNDTLNQTLSALTESNAQRMTEIRAGLEQSIQTLQGDSGQKLETVRLAMQQQATATREEQSLTLKRFGDALNQTLATLTESNAQRMAEVRATLEQKIQALQNDNAARLEEMRKTVDEKLHATLEQRLGESFRLVSERLEKVHQGLGEMQQLAVGVGDLKRVLTNVKTRGAWGEVQLEMLLEQVLTPEQYAKNVETVPGTGERVEFAISLPGKADDRKPVWLPIDAKFPKEQYERLVEAAEHADADGVAAAARELERTVRNEAKTIAEKYLSPPLTTDFAILFLPTEGLYAEVMRRPGLSDELQRTHRVSIAGPSTLSALLNSLQMGFRTLALEKRSSEVWQVLGAVKTEFGKFGDVLATTRATLERAAKNIENAEVRTRQMTRKLKSVEALPTEVAQQLLGVESAQAVEADDL